MAHRGRARLEMKALGRKRSKTERLSDQQSYWLNRSELFQTPVQEWPKNLVMSIPQADMGKVPDLTRFMVTEMDIDMRGNEIIHPNFIRNEKYFKYIVQKYGTEIARKMMANFRSPTQQIQSA